MVATTGSFELDVLGSRFSIHSEEPRWLELLRLLWKPFESRSSRTGSRIEIRADNGGWTLDFAGKFSNSSSDPWRLANALRNAIYAHAIEDSPPVVPLHAAALARGLDALLLVGPPGTGKTTLTLQLLSRGWGYLSDDLAAIDPASGHVLPVAKPLHIKTPGDWAEYRRLWEPPAWLPPPSKSFLIPASIWPVVSEPSRPRLLAFPIYLARSPTKLAQLTSGVALARCLQNVRPPDAVTRGKAAAVIRRLCEKARAAELVYGSADEGGACLAEWAQQSLG